MNIAVFGANGPTGRLLTKQALAEGHTVTAVTRHPEAFPLRHERLHVLPGDVFELAAVERAVAGQDAVLSTLGVPFSRKPITVYSRGVGHILDAMDRYGVRRFVCVSSSATDEHLEPQGGIIFGKVLQPLIVGVFGRTVYDDMRRMEALVTRSDVDWTIVRPSGLFTTPTVTAYRVGDAHQPARYTSRMDLADCMLRQLTDDRFVRKIVSVATVSQQPNMLAFIWREAISKSA
jgi:putative NADH-flavin reductase